MAMSQETMKKWYAKGALWIAPEDSTVCFREENVTQELLNELKKGYARLRWSKDYYTNRAYLQATFG